MSLKRKKEKQRLETEGISKQESFIPTPKSNLNCFSVDSYAFMAELHKFSFASFLSNFILYNKNKRIEEEKEKLKQEEERLKKEEEKLLYEQSIEKQYNRTFYKKKENIEKIICDIKKESKEKNLSADDLYLSKDLNKLPFLLFKLNGVENNILSRYDEIINTSTNLKKIEDPTDFQKELAIDNDYHRSLLTLVCTRTFPELNSIAKLIPKEYLQWNK